MRRQKPIKRGPAIKSRKAVPDRTIKSVKRELSKVFQQIGLKKKDEARQLRQRVTMWKREAIVSLGYAAGIKYDKHGKFLHFEGLSDQGSKLMRQAKVWGVAVQLGYTKRSGVSSKSIRGMQEMSTEASTALRHRQKAGAVFFEKRTDGWFDLRTKKYVTEAHVSRSIGQQKYWERLNGLRRVLDLDLKQGRRLYRALSKIREIEMSGVKVDVPEWVRSIVREVVTQVSKRALKAMRPKKRGRKPGWKARQQRRLKLAKKEIRSVGPKGMFPSLKKKTRKRG